MNPAPSSPEKISRWPLLLLASALALAALGGLHIMLQTTPPPSAQAAAQDVWPQYLPVMLAPSLVGRYDCTEYEFGMAWNSEVITLHPGGQSIYEYPGAFIVTGTWVYTPTTLEVGFTNFRWTAVNYVSPDILWASEYLTEPGFEVAVYCWRQ